MAKVYHVRGNARSGRGESVRYLGLTASGAKAKFHLGSDVREATIRRTRLEQFWERLAVERWDAIGYEVAKAVAKGVASYRLPKELVPIPDPEAYLHYVGRWAVLGEGIICVVPEDDATYASGLAEAARQAAIRTMIDAAYPSASTFPQPSVPVGGRTSGSIPQSTA